MLKAEGLEYEVRGEGEPVLLIHGSHVADALLPLAREPVLADRFRLIQYHRRGFGGSDAHTGPFSIEQQARDARRLVQKLEPGPVHVVGYSYGALTAIQLALDAPSAVRSLVLLEPPLRRVNEDPATSPVFSPLLELYRSGDARGAVDAFMRIVGGPDWRAEVSGTVPGGPEQAEKDAATFFEVELPALQGWSVDRDKASRISQPVLYVTGSESGSLVDPPKQLFLSSLPHAEEAVLPGLNHLLQMRNPSLVAHRIADFLARHPLNRPTARRRLS